MAEYLFGKGVTYEEALAYLTGKTEEPVRPPRGELSVFSAMENLAPSGKKVVEHAIRETLSSQSCTIELGHLALGALGDDDGQVVSALKKLGADVETLRSSIRTAITCTPSDGSSIIFSPDAAEALKEADRVSRELGHDLVTDSDIMLGILSAEGSVVFSAIEQAGTGIQNLKSILPGPETPPEPEIGESA